MHAATSTSMRFALHVLVFIKYFLKTLWIAIVSDDWRLLNLYSFSYWTISIPCTGSSVTHKMLALIITGGLFLCTLRVWSTFMRMADEPKTKNHATLTIHSKMMEMRPTGRRFVFGKMASQVCLLRTYYVCRMQNNKIIRNTFCSTFLIATMWAPIFVRVTTRKKNRA